MAFNLDNIFGIHEKALQLRGQRTKVLAENIANADTPNYKARDLDFNAALKQAQNDNYQLKATHKGHIGSGNAGLSRAEMLYRIPLQPSLDGNTVDSHVEQAKFSENAIEYQASITFLNGRIKGLLSAIRGE